MQEKTHKLRSNSKSKGKRPLKAIDFFCGAGGMTNGFTKAGIRVLAGIDIDSECKETYEVNNPKSKFIEADIKKLTFKDLIKKTKIKRNDKRLIFIGCSPCQYWTKISTDKTKSKESRNLLKDFQRFVHYFKPGCVVIENVPGILKKGVRSPLSSFLKFLEDEGYTHNCDVLNSCHYGVPQTRKRFLLIASNQMDEIILPKASKKKLPTVRKFIGSFKRFRPIRAGHTDSTEFMHTSCKLEPQNIERLRMTPTNGGTRLSWKKTKLQIPTYEQRDDSFRDIYNKVL
jgi:DNA (cytosine-5)-methyltransferase 1